MGIAKAFGWDAADNWIDPRRNTLLGLGAGLLSGNLGNAPLYAMQGMQADTEATKSKAAEAERAAQTNATSEWLKANFPEYANLPPAQGFQLAQAALSARTTGDGSTANMRDWQYGQQNPGYLDFLKGGTGGGEFGLTPIWGQFPDGSFGYGVQGKDGTFRQVDTGDLNILDPRTLNSEKAFGTATGKAGGEATAAAPGDISSGQVALDLIDQIRTSPQLDNATGFLAGIGGNKIPGTGQYGFQNLVDQAKSGAFLTAVQEMRGLGALSNNEGQAATQAITRMNTALSKDDFLKALQDYEAIVTRGMQRAQARLNQPAGAQQSAPSGGQTLTFNPATGELE